MPIFKVKVIKEKTWIEYCEGTAYIEANSLEQAEKKARRINRAIREGIYDSSEFDGIEFDEGEMALINTKDFAEGNEEFVTTAQQLHDSDYTDPDINFELGQVEEVKDTINESEIAPLSVPHRSEFGH